MGFLQSAGGVVFVSFWEEVRQVRHTVRVSPVLLGTMNECMYFLIIVRYCTKLASGPDLNLNCKR